MIPRQVRLAAALAAFAAAGLAGGLSYASGSDSPRPHVHAGHDHEALEAGVRADRGKPDTGSRIATTRGSETAALARGDWGALAYRNANDELCLAAGALEDGRVGDRGRKGFRALDVADAPGNCGDYGTTVQAEGGVALVHSGPSSGGSSDLTTIVYGVAGSAGTTVEVRLPNGRRIPARVTAVKDVAGVPAAFAAPLPVDDPAGMVVEFTRPDGQTGSVGF